MDSLRKNIKWILLIAAVLLAIGCFKLPIGYYTFLRIVVCITAILAIIANKDSGFDWCNIIFALIAIFFNPIIPIHLHSKLAWTIIDAICAVWMGYGFYHLKKNK